MIGCRKNIMKELMLIFIAIEIFICSVGIAFFSASDSEKNNIRSFFLKKENTYIPDVKTLVIETAIPEFVPCKKKEYDDYFKIKYFQNDSTPLFFGKVILKFFDKDGKTYSPYIFEGNSISVAELHKISSEELQMKIFENCIKKDSIVLEGGESKSVVDALSRHLMLIRDRSYDGRIVLSFRRDEKRSEKVFLKTVELDSTCEFGNSVQTELQYLGEGIVYFSVTTTGPSYGIENVKIVDKWKSDYIPILDLCDECKFKKIDSNRCELSGMIETTKARADALFRFMDPKIEFFAYPPSEKIKKMAKLDLCFENKDVLNGQNDLKKIDKDVYRTKKNRCPSKKLKEHYGNYGEYEMLECNGSNCRWRYEKGDDSWYRSFECGKGKTYERY